jgi:hypothetical protein
MMTNLILRAALCLLALPLLVIVAVEESDFVELSTPVPQISDGFVSFIIGNNSCAASSNVEIQYPNTMFTIRPSIDEAGTGYGPIVVKSFPPDLVTISSFTHEDGLSLEFQFNEAAIGPSNNVTEGGVLIIVSRDQLLDVLVQSSMRVQVLPGFRSLSTLSASTHSQVTADFSTLPSTSSQVFVFMDNFAQMTLASGNPIAKLRLSTSSQLLYAGGTRKMDFNNSYMVDTNAILKVKGELSGGCNFFSGANVVVDGLLWGSFWADSFVNLSVSGEILGLVKVGTDTQVTTNTSGMCAKVELHSWATGDDANMIYNNGTSTANCIEGSVEAVDVVINELPLTLQGTRTCSRDANNSCTCTVVSFATESDTGTEQSTTSLSQTASPNTSKSPSSTASQFFSARRLLGAASLLAIMGYM